MNRLKHTALVFAALLLVGHGSAFGGQALIAPTKYFYDDAALVAIVEVQKVTQVEVATGGDQTSIVYVAEAEVLQTLKSDLSPIPEKRKIAIVGSTIPLSSAVWEPIETKRYLAFLNSEQGHYRYEWKYALRPISPDGKVEWFEQTADGDYERLLIDIEEVVKRIQSEQDDGE